MKFKKLFSKKKKAEHIVPPNEAQNRCSFIVDVGDRRVDVRLYDELGFEVASAFGYIIHEGTFGVAQAASFAAMKISKDLNGGKF